LNTITTGIVADANDPQQMGRLRVICPAYGDNNNLDLEDIPWAVYVSPMGGTTDLPTRGVGQESSTGPVAYGMWGIPVEGAKAVVGCFDGNPQNRFWMGCIHEQFTTNTLPHGRYFGKPEFNPPNNFKGTPAGPYSSYESPIQPYTKNIQQAFSSSTQAYEYTTRGVDYSVSAVNSNQINTSPVASADDAGITANNKNFTQGYGINTMFPSLKYPTTGKGYRSMTYSWTSPGFHSISMDDRPENCRVRLRTTGGNHIILDDTNERMYFQTAKGSCYVEFDECGYGHLYFDKGLNFRSKGDMNFYSDTTVRIYGATGVHILTDGELRQTAAKDISIKTNQNYRLFATKDCNIQTASSLNILAKSSAQITSQADLNLLASGKILETGSQIHLNGPSAQQAAQAGEKVAYNPSWIVDHEPWGRSPTNSNHDTAPMVPYDSNQNGQIDTTGQTITRNKYWRR
jgi:hypothetical protein